VQMKKAVCENLDTGRKKIYISSKMTGLEDFNFPAFYKKAMELRNMGLEVLNPAEIGDTYGKYLNTSFYRRKNLEMLLQADILFVFGDVENSKGVEFEKLIARELDLPIWREEREANNNAAI
ncbi:MAG: DUF4406 domain-containing protein, partial [Elusimicrobiaceae bacterium]